MGRAELPRPVLRLVAAFSRHTEPLQWGKEQAQTAWGLVALESEPFLHTETNYYDQEMGPGLVKQFWAFADLQPPGDLADWKLQSNVWETDYAARGEWPEPRPLNLDPGYLTEAKLVLATTKDRDHRLYLRDGIYAEVTLRYRRKKWEAWPWTYPDYQRPEYHEFFDRCRQYLRQSLQAL